MPTVLTHPRPLPVEEGSGDEVNQGAIPGIGNDAGDFLLGFFMSARGRRRAGGRARDERQCILDFSSPVQGGSTTREGSGFYCNRACEFYPCHGTGGEALNCMFCYCPMYEGDCPGQAAFVRAGAREVKDCSGCDYPHRAENYDAVIRHIMQRVWKEGLT